MAIKCEQGRFYSWFHSLTQIISRNISDFVFRNGSVNPSAGFLLESMSLGVTVPFAMHSFTKWYFKSTRFAPFMLSDFSTQLFAVVSSQNGQDGSRDSKPSSGSTVLIHFASENALHIDLYSVLGLGECNWCLHYTIPSKDKATNWCKPSGIWLYSQVVPSEGRIGVERQGLFNYVTKTVLWRIWFCEYDISNNYCFTL